MAKVQSKTDGSEYTSQISNIEAQSAVSQVLASPEFHQANRLREFLAYVTNEAIEGRGADITGRTIAQDVYQRGRSGNDSDLSVVRVDAGRLRRRLIEYYTASGKTDPVQISIPTGSYAPLFFAAQNEPPPPERQSAPKGKRTKPLLYGLLAAAILTSIFAIYERRTQAPLPKTTLPADTQRAVARKAVFGKSPASLQAVNQAEQARALLFPALDPKRLMLVAGLFKHVIDLDDQYFGGYAGAAQTYAILSVLTPSQATHLELSAQAAAFSDRAVSLNPTSGWAQSASALVAFTKRDFARANQLSVSATSLAPQDIFVWEVDALIALFSGEFDRAISSAAPDHLLMDHTARSPNRNVLGTANFHLGKYEDSIRHFEDAVAMGDPVSQVTVFYLVAGYQAIGQTGHAREMARYYRRAWKDARADKFLTRIFDSKIDLQHAISLVNAAGLNWE